MEDKYLCKKCGDEWFFFPDDYENPWDYPEVCPLCTMPLSQMIRDVYEEDGVIEVIKRLFLRVAQ